MSTASFPSKETVIRQLPLTVTDQVPFGLAFRDLLKDVEMLVAAVEAARGLD